METDMDDEERIPELPARVGALLSRRDTWAAPPPELRDDALAALRRERDAAPVSGGDELARARERRAARRGPLLAVAASVVAVLVVGSVLVASRTGSDALIVALAGTELAPAASGRAEIRGTPSGFAIELDVAGLAPAPEGSYYQAWLRNADDQAVTIGTFHGREGSEDVVLWSGVDPRDYPTLTVTLQPEGGGAESSGQVVLRGTIDT